MRRKGGIGFLWVSIVLLLIWSLCGTLVTIMIVYGVFDNVALGPAVMATIVATGNGFLGVLTALAVLRALRRTDPLLDYYYGRQE